MTGVLIVGGGSPAALRTELTARECQVHTAASFDAALDVVVEERLDLIVFDLGWPDDDGVPAIREMRAWTPVPIIVLAGRVAPERKINALDAGADDYLSAPFSVDELLARFRSIVRRQAGGLRPTSVRVGRCHVDLSNHRVDSSDGTGRRVYLTRTEWLLLEALVAEPGKLIPQPQLLQRIWGAAYGGKSQNLRQYMAQLRRKFEVDPARPRHLLTEWGVGCRFQP
jgi:two-component system KDP operon response regulator KdpE